MRGVVRIVRRQTGIPDFLRHAKPTKYLHRARGDMVALHARRLAAITRLHNCDGDSARRKIERQRDPDRARSDHQDVTINSGCLHLGDSGFGLFQLPKRLEHRATGYWRDPGKGQKNPVRGAGTPSMAFARTDNP